MKFSLKYKIQFYGKKTMGSCHDLKNQKNVPAVLQFIKGWKSEPYSRYFYPRVSKNIVLFI